MEKEIQLIETLINHHFCIKNSNIDDIQNVLDISYSEKIFLDNKFNWYIFLDKKKDKFDKRFLLLDKINEWNYLRWNLWDFEETKKMSVFLSKELNTNVNYFFIDPWILTCRWVLANKGKLIESYFESHEQVLNDEGNWELITEDKREGEDEFWEDKFWNLYKQTCQPINIINDRKKILAIVGELK